jgi:hypothetical protein
MAERHAHFALLAVLVLTGAFLGTAAGTLVVRSQLETAGPGPVDDGSEKLHAAIDKLAREVEALRVQQAAAVAAQAGAPRALEPATVVKKDSPAPRAEARPAEGSSATSAVKQLTDEQIRELIEKFNKAENPFQARNDHFFMTYEEILGRYGVPTSVSPSGSGPTWHYESTTSRGMSQFFSVNFSDGHVVRLDYSKP